MEHSERLLVKTVQAEGEPASATVDEVRDAYHNSHFFSKDLQKAFTEASRQAHLENEHLGIPQHTHSLHDPNDAPPRVRHESISEDLME